ncbi:Hpt domain-containing protein [Methylobacterium sp. P31]
MHGRSPGELAGHAHALASQAGFLGFVALREQCLAVEATCSDEPKRADLAASLSSLIQECDAARSQLHQLEATLGEGSPQSDLAPS